VIDIKKYGPWAVITGGSDGTGAAYAREVAASGINLFLIARRAGPLEALASELRAAHRVEIETMVQDLNDPNAAEAIIAQVGTREVGLYVSNAGASSDHGTFMDKPLASHLDLITRNVLVPTKLAHDFGGKMAARGRGGIVIMSSGAGMGGQAGVASYSAVKAYQMNLGEALWAELKPVGVDVIVIAAPIMETPTLRGQLGDMVIPDIHQSEDVARLALARLPEGCSYVYSIESDPALNEAQTKVRRDRVVMLQEIVAALFGRG
jgi:uncharacterized protein